jgi:hypothetical protein
MRASQKNPYLVKPGQQPPKKGEQRWPLTAEKQKGDKKDGQE